MKVAITQPNFLPWLGYFELLDKVDLFISLDNVQTTKRSFIVRNQVKSPNGNAKWISVNLEKASRGVLIMDAILAKGGWWALHFEKIRNYYQEAPFLDKYNALIWELLNPGDDETLGDYNLHIIQKLVKELGITVEFQKSSDIQPVLEGTPQEKILAILNKVGATEFYNFKRGVDVGLYQPDILTSQRILLFKQDYQHPEYAQTGEEFLPYMAIIDLLVNKGEKAREILLSGSNWVKMN